MQISSVSPVQATAVLERQTTTQIQPKAQVVDGSSGPTSQVAPVPKGIVPAPGLRPNVQDYVDIDRTLIALRRM